MEGRIVKEGTPISRGERYAVVGLGTSNQAVIRYLLRQGARVTAYDQKESIPLPHDVVSITGHGYLDRLAEELDGLSGIFVTPGMRKDLPVLAEARSRGIPLLGEAAVVLQASPLPVVGITGSSGKTTTTTMVGQVMERAFPGSVVGGNIGFPLIDRLEELGRRDGAWMVLELSSFQLELADRSPRVAALLNLHPNHLDVHGTFANYRDAKRRIYRFQGPEDAAIFNVDDPVSAELWQQAPGRRFFFSGLHPVARGAGVEDGWVVWYGERRSERVLPLTDIRLPGPHNVANVAAAVTIASAAGAHSDVVAEVVRSFTGVPHRLEWVRTRRGQTWINDSIATAPDRTLAALAAYRGRSIVLLAGGSDKHLPLDELGRGIARDVDHLIVYGEMAEAIEAAVRAAGEAISQTPTIDHVADLAHAVACAAEHPVPGQVVLLSPACASYDQFANFEERGTRFRDLVWALPE